MVYDTEKNLLGKDRLVILNDDTALEKKEVVTVVAPKEDDFVGFRGMVTEDTKTKAGRDFYKLFYSEYLLKSINGKQIVKIIEDFSLGRNTIIDVKIDNTIVHRFNVIPRTEYIKQQANQAIRNVSRYFQNQEKQRENITKNN